MKPLEEVLRDWREGANLLRHYGEKDRADVLDRFLDEVQAAAAPFLEWLTEDQAKLRSGRSCEYWRGKFPALEAQGLAKKEGRRRYYRQCGIPARVNLEAARAAARREAEAA